MRALYISIIVVALSGCSLLPGSGDVSSSEITTDYLMQHWVHSFEEDSEGSDVDLFRPHDYKEFPLSRFRMQYVFEEGGSARWLYLAPDDAHYFKPGTWRLDHDQKDVIVVDQGGRIVSYRVLELTRHTLRMTRIATQETGAR